MWRHPALRDLSRDHHGALIQAQALRKGTQDGAAVRPEALVEFARGLIEFCDADLFPHLREEDEVLLPFFERAGRGVEDGEVRLRILEDHAWLRRSLDSLRSVQKPEYAGSLLAEIGRRLHDHTRFEEDRWFPRLQELLSEDEFRAIGDRSRAFRDRWRSPQVCRADETRKALKT